jgi:aminoglycoside 6'-N-acetyltransferase
MIADPGLLSFRPFVVDDLPLLYRWLNEAHVARWYRDEAGRPFEAIVQHYDPVLRGAEGIRQFVITYSGQAIGQIQTYLVSDPSEYGGPALVDPRAAAVDLLIGEPAFVHQGLGAHILRRFVHEVVFRAMGATCCLLDPERDNSAAIRCYMRAGFRPITTFRRPESRIDFVLMRLDRTGAPGPAAASPPSYPG